MSLIFTNCFNCSTATKQLNAFWQMFNQFIRLKELNGITKQSTSLKSSHMVRKKKTFSIVSFIELIFFMNCVISVAKWKKLTAKTVKTRERFRGYDANQKESSTIPGIELYDIIDGTVFFINLTNS